MPDFLTLTCPTCGAKLKVTDQIHVLACANCGNEHMVHRDGGAIYLAPMAQDVRQIRAGVDKTAAELAVARLTKEIAAMEQELNILRRKIHTKETKTDEWLGWGVIMALLLIVISALSSPPWFAVAIGVIVIALVIWYASVNARRARELNRQRQLDVDRIQTQITAKKAALATNQRIAES